MSDLLEAASTYRQMLATRNSLAQKLNECEELSRSLRMKLNDADTQIYKLKDALAQAAAKA